MEEKKLKNELKMKKNGRSISFCIMHLILSLFMEYNRSGMETDLKFLYLREQFTQSSENWTDYLV